MFLYFYFISNSSLKETIHAAEEKMVMADELYMFSVGDEIPVDNIETNVSEKEFTCSQCSETFEDRSTLFKHVHVRHKQHVHSRRKFKCDRCEKIFKSMVSDLVTYYLKQDYSIRVTDDDILLTYDIITN